MIVVKPRVEVEGPIDGAAILRSIERVARTCYKSEDLACDGSAERLVAKLLSHDPPHLAMCDHVTIRAKFVVDRGITHEIVRHRIGVAYAQESTRYCNYSKGKFSEQITVIEPPGLTGGAREAWLTSVATAERCYLAMVANGASPQLARSVLPTCTKAELYVTASVTAWRHIFKLRTGKAAHPQMRQVMVPLVAFLAARCPILFDDIDHSEIVDPAEVVEVTS